MNLKSSILIAIFSAVHAFTFAQDYSEIKKSISFSAELNQAKTVKSLDEALLNPQSVVDLNLLIQEETDFAKFTEAIPRFTNLRKLILNNYYDYPVTLSAKIWELKKLEFISCYCIRFESFDGIANLNDLKYLSLTGSRLTVLPSELFALKNLEFLDLTLNFLKDIPAEISSLEKLRELDLSNNCFDAIPVTVTQLAQLEYLDFDNPETSTAFHDGTAICRNQLNTFPDLSKMTALKDLSVYKLIVSSEETRQKIEASNHKGIKSKRSIIYS